MLFKTSRTSSTKIASNLKKKRYFFFFTVFILLFPLSVLFPLQSTSIKLKNKKETPNLGYIDIQYIFEHSSLKEQFTKKYIAYKENLIREKDNEQKELSQLQLSLYKEANLLGYSEFQEKIQTFQDQLTKHKESLKKIQNALQEWEASHLERLLDSLIITLQVVSNEYNVDIILSKEPNIIYTNRKYDLTKKVIQLLDKESIRNELTTY